MLGSINSIKIKKFIKSADNLINCKNGLFYNYLRTSEAVTSIVLLTYKYHSKLSFKINLISALICSASVLNIYTLGTYDDISTVALMSSSIISFLLIGFIVGSFFGCIMTFSALISTVYIGLIVFDILPKDINYDENDPQAKVNSFSIIKSFFNSLFIIFIIFNLLSKKTIR